MNKNVNMYNQISSGIKEIEREQKKVYEVYDLRKLANKLFFIIKSLFEYRLFCWYWKFIVESTVDKGKSLLK